MRPSDLLSEPYRGMMLDSDQVDAILCETGELTPDFLFFPWCYEAVAEIVPFDAVVIDLGGYVGFQQALFRNHAGYVDVDEYDLAEDALYPQPRRYVESCAHVKHVCMSMQDYLEEREHARTVGIQQNTSPYDKEYAIVSAVPGVYRASSLVETIKLSFPFGGVVWYPGALTVAWGCCAGEVKVRLDSAIM